VARLFDRASHSVIEPDAARRHERQRRDDDRFFSRRSVGRLRLFVGAYREVTPSVLAADHALSREFHQDEPYRRAASFELRRELSFGRQPPTWP
jgi:hypothetical protein